MPHYCAFIYFKKFRLKMSTTAVLSTFLLSAACRRSPLLSSFRHQGSLSCEHVEEGEEEERDSGCSSTLPRSASARHWGSGGHSPAQIRLLMPKGETFTDTGRRKPLPVDILLEKLWQRCQKDDIWWEGVGKVFDSLIFNLSFIDLQVLKSYME